MVNKHICIFMSVVMLVCAAACHSTNSSESSKAPEIITASSVSATDALSDIDSETEPSTDLDMETAPSADDVTIDNNESSSTDSDSDDPVSTDSSVRAPRLMNRSPRLMPRHGLKRGFRHIHLTLVMMKNYT